MKRYLTTVLFGFVVMMMALTPAYAVPTLSISDGTTAQTITIADGTWFLDFHPAAGVVFWSGLIGNWDVSVNVGVTKPAQGSGVDPYMHLNSVDTIFADSNGAAGGTLTIKFSETGFGPTPAISFVSDLGGVLGNGSISFKTYLDYDNELFGTDVLLTDSGTITTLGAFANTTTSGLANGGFPYSLTQVVELALSGPGTSSFDAEVKAVPEPSTLLLLGSGLVALGVGIRRRNKVK